MTKQDVVDLYNFLKTNPDLHTNSNASKSKQNNIAFRVVRAQCLHYLRRTIDELLHGSSTNSALLASHENK